jgi:hypothetical protein
LEPNHTHVVVVPGADWGDEVPWLSAVAATIAGDAPSITLLANGGEIVYRDGQASLAAGRRAFVLLEQDELQTRSYVRLRQNLPNPKRGRSRSHGSSASCRTSRAQ